MVKRKSSPHLKGRQRDAGKKWIQFLFINVPQVAPLTAMVYIISKTLNKNINVWQVCQKKQKNISCQFKLQHPEQPTPADVCHFRFTRHTSGQKFLQLQLSMRRRQSNQRDSCTFLSRGDRGDGAMRSFMFYSSFFCSFFWKHTGKMESTARTPSTAREFQDTASPAVVSLYRVVPALIATNDGGATPVNKAG